MKRLLILIACALLLYASHACADPGDFVSYDLSLAGYRIGMSFDEADALRPFQYSGRMDNKPNVYARIEQVYVDDVSMDIDLRFKEHQLDRITARISPGATAEVKERLLESFGDGEDHSKEYTNFEGALISQHVTKWTFPHTQVIFILSSNNKDYSTLSMSLRKDKAKDVATNRAG